MAALAAPAGALQPPWTQTIVDSTQEISMICRANGGALGGNQEADQRIPYRAEAPDGVMPGETFDIILKPGLSIFPHQQTAPIVGTATVQIVRNLSTRYQIPHGVTINSIAFTDTPGSPVATPAAGYFVTAATVPDALTSANPTQFYPQDWDPLVNLTPAQRVAIPGTTPTAVIDTVGTNVIKLRTLGSGTGGSGNFPGGSALQPPWIKVNVTATAPAGTELVTTVFGQTPNAVPASPPYSASIPGNMPNPTVSGGDPTVFTNWPNATFTTTAVANAIVTVTAPAACAPGYEQTAEFPNPPTYMVGPGALPNGTQPPIARTMVVYPVDEQAPVITIERPINGGKYVTDQVVTAAFDCNDYFGSGDDVCTAENDGNAIENGEPLAMSDGAHSLTVTAIDNDGNESTLTHSYTVAPNQDPIANAGPDQTGRVSNQLVTLTAAASADPDGPPAQPITSYAWVQVPNGAPTVTINNANTVSPTFTVATVDNPVGHTYEFEVTVTDGFGGSDTDTVLVSSVPTNPTVGTPTKTRVGGGTTFFVGDIVQLNPGAITNVDGNNPADYTYVWTQTTGRTVTLSNPNAQNPTFIVPPRGDTGSGTTTACQNNSTGAASATHQGCPRFTVTVTKTNTNRTSAASAVLGTWTVPTLPARPTANAGATQNVFPLDVVTLNGSGAQAQGHAISYEWAQTGGPTSVLLSNVNAPQPTFTAPNIPGSYTFSLITRDTQSALSTAVAASLNFSTTATTTVNVSLYPLPQADAGDDQTVLVSTPVQLDGSASFDPSDHPINHTWTQLSGTPVMLSDVNAISPTFTAPVEPSTLVFRLTVDDGPFGGSTTDDVTINVYNTAPEVDAGASQNVSKKDIVTLDGSAEDDDGHTLTYTWLQVSGPPVLLSNINAPKPTFEAPNAPASLSFQLTVDDGHGGITSDSTSVTVVVIPGLDFAASTEPNFKPETAKSNFKLTVTNDGAAKNTVSTSIVNVLITVNGVPVPGGQVVVDNKSAQLGVGKSTNFQVTWNHGPNILQLGDDIAVTECVSALGDEDPDNNCTTWNSLVPNLNASVASSLATVKKGSVKDTIKVSVINTGAGRIAPIRDTDVTLTVSYGSGPAQVTRTVLATPLVIGLAPGDARNFAFAWDHPKLPVGTPITVQACINAPNNVSALSCTTYGLLVS